MTPLTAFTPPPGRRGVRPPDHIKQKSANPKTSYIYVARTARDDLWSTLLLLYVVETHQIATPTKRLVIHPTFDQFKKKSVLTGKKNTLYYKTFQTNTFFKAAKLKHAKHKVTMLLLQNLLRNNLGKKKPDCACPRSVWRLMQLLSQKNEGITLQMIDQIIDGG